MHLIFSVASCLSWLKLSLRSLSFENFEEDSYFLFALWNPEVVIVKVVLSVFILVPFLSVLRIGKAVVSSLSLLFTETVLVISFVYFAGLSSFSRYFIMK